MNILLSTGILIFIGFLLGELATKISLPKVSGYIIAGVLLNPGLTSIVSSEYIEASDPLINLSLSVITFHIGGSLSISKIRAQGKLILVMTLFESLFAYLSVFAFLFIASHFVFNLFDSLTLALAFSLIIASLAAPTDPSATLAVMNEYKARGPVSSSVLEIAAFDDIMGIILFTLSLASAKLLMGSSDASFTSSLWHLLGNIGLAVGLGVCFGLMFNLLSRMFVKESDGALIVMIIGILLACFGTAQFLDLDELLSTLSMGVMVVNYNKNQQNIFGVVERYTEELIFVIFFTLSGLHLQLSSLSGSYILIALFVVARALGKYGGIYVSSSWLKALPVVRKYTTGGLFPQGGIVIGLALTVLKDKAFDDFSTLVMGVVLGAAIIHELIGPVVSKYSLKKAGEIEE